jgi:hypothetical protein
MTMSFFISDKDQLCHSHFIRIKSIKASSKTTIQVTRIVTRQPTYSYEPVQNETMPQTTPPAPTLLAFANPSPIKPETTPPPMHIQTLQPRNHHLLSAQTTPPTHRRKTKPKQHRNRSASNKVDPHSPPSQSTHPHALISSTRAKH